VYSGGAARFTGITAYEGVAYRDLWPGIDATYARASSGVESTFVVAPGADPRAIALRYEGHHSILIDAHGRLVVEAPFGQLTESPPIAYQEIDGARRFVAVAFAIEGDVARFALGGYDASRPLIIDPVLSYSSYLGGSGTDQANAIAVDAAGAIYVAGFTTSTNFPTATPHQAANAGSRDMFISKLNAAGSALVYSTYIGGADVDEASAIALDASNNAYIAGSTFSTNFPTLAPLQAANGGGQDAVVLKLNASGGLAYATYLGGTDDDFATGIAVGGTNAYVTGKTLSGAFPTATPYQAALSGVSDAFVSKLVEAGSSLAYSTYLGGALDETGRAIAVDATGAAYVTGTTSSTAFPLLGAYDGSLGGTKDTFVTKLTAAGTGLTYSTYLGGAAVDEGYGIALDGANNAYIAGITASTDFPVVSAFQPANAGGDDGFLAKFTAAGSALSYSTYFGGTMGDAASAVAVDGAGLAHLTGSTFSSNFPLLLAFDASYVGPAADAFIIAFDPALTGAASRIGSSYLGAFGSDRGWGVDATSAGDAYVTGSTQSSSFPVVAPYQAAYAGLADAFVAKITPGTPPSVGGKVADVPYGALGSPDRPGRTLLAGGEWFLAVAAIAAAAGVWTLRRH
jgi:hypothetical protein